MVFVVVAAAAAVVVVEILSVLESFVTTINRFVPKARFPKCCGSYRHRNLIFPVALRRLRQIILAVQLSQNHTTQHCLTQLFAKSLTLKVGLTLLSGRDKTLFTSSVL